MEKFLLEASAVKQIIGPVDLNTAANTGERVDMKDVERVTFICSLAAGTTTSAHVFSLKQHLAASGGTPAALAVANPYYHKIAAATVFTKVEVETEEDEYDLDSILNDDIAIVAFEVLAEDLNRAGGYRWVSLDVSDTGGAQLGSVVAVVKHHSKPSYDKAV